MIGAWRKAWHANTQGETDLLFPFGFVQLSSWGQPSNVRRDPNPIAVVRYVSNYHTHHHTHHRPHPYTTLHPRSPPDFTYKYIIQPTTALIANPMLCYSPPLPPPQMGAAPDSGAGAEYVHGDRGRFGGVPRRLRHSAN